MAPAADRLRRPDRAGRRPVDDPGAAVRQLAVVDVRVDLSGGGVGAWPFHRDAWTNLRHGAVTMDTLISVGVTAAYLWSVWALFFTPAGMTGMRMPLGLMPSSAGGDAAHLYLEVASAVTTFIVAGRYFEASAKRTSGTALRALLDMGAKDVAVLENGPNGQIERRILVAALNLGHRFVVRPGERDRHRRHCGIRLLHGGRLDADPGVGTGRGRARRRGGRCDGERRGPSGRMRHPRRSRNPTGSDGAPGAGRTERQGAGTAAGGPGLLSVRPGRHRPVRDHLVGVAI